VKMKALYRVGTVLVLCLSRRPKERVLTILQMPATWMKYKRNVVWPLHLSILLVLNLRTIIIVLPKSTAMVSALDIPVATFSLEEQPMRSLKRVNA